MNELIGKSVLDRFALKSAIILLVSGYTASGEYDIGNATDILQEIIDAYLEEMAKQKK